jgi:hypothetical protein
MTGYLRTTSELISPLGGQIGLFGILPTFLLEHTDPRYYSPDKPRYPLLDKNLNKLYGPIRLDLRRRRGDKLSLRSKHVGVEAANTSLQIHLSTQTHRFVSLYNAALIAMPIVLAACTGSPLLFGKSLWAENRIRLFEAAVRDRAFFPKGWIHSPEEPFKACLQWQAALPEVFGPLGHESTSEDWMLREFNLHNHSTYPWLRAVIGPDGLRLEIRHLPAGPTVIDMAANATLLIGLILWVQQRIEIDNWLNRELLKFEQVTQNFYAAAEHGYDAQMYWVGNRGPTKLPARSLVRSLLPDIAKTLVSYDINPADVNNYLGVVDQRLGSGQTASGWMRHHFAIGRNLNATTLRYLELSRNGQGPPVGTWPAD